jgi:hypothetical protein
VKRRMREEHFLLRGLKRLDGPGGPSTSKICVGSHSSKLQHRAPLEIRSNLSHVRKTLESGIPVPPSAPSLDVVGQWLLCCAGASPSEGPYTKTQRETRVSSMKSFWIQKVVKAKTNEAAKYLLIHKQTIRESPKKIEFARAQADCQAGHSSKWQAS